MSSFTRVTAPLSPWWRAEMGGNVPDDVIDNAARRGTDVHRVCACEALGLPVYPGPDDDAVPYIESFWQWFALVDHVEACEIELRNDALALVGHPDILCRLRGEPRLSLWDFKTAQQWSQTWRMQLAAYREMACQQGYDVARSGVIQLSPTGGRPKVTDAGNNPEDLAAYLSALNVYRYMRNGKENKQ